MGRITVDFALANNYDVLQAKAGKLAPENVRRVQLQGIVDTGSARLVLPAGVVAQLGLPSAEDATVRYADQRTAIRPTVEEARVELLGRHGSFRAVVEPNRNTALIGAIVLEDLDLVVDCTKQQLLPRDPDRIISEIE
jgi:predicted aspartyl protease